MADTYPDLEKALKPATSHSQLAFQERASFLSLATSQAESDVSTVVGDKYNKRDSITTIDVPEPVYVNNRLPTVIEQNSVFPTPRLSLAADNRDVIIEQEEDLPPKSGSTFTRWLRWTWFSYYRRLFTFVFGGNMIALIVLLTRPNTAEIEGFAGVTYTSTITAAAVNLVVAILMRNEHVVNLLFRLSVAVPITAPLWIRRRVAKIYSYGGLHSGCGVAAIVWYIVFSGIVARHIAVAPKIQPAIATLTFVILSLLLAIGIFAHPTLRQKFHNTFENTHRFLGWTIIGLFWAQVVLTVHYDSQPAGASTTGYYLIHTPAFWCLIIITLCIIYPWARLRRRAVRAEELSPHAIRIHFDHPIPTYCMGIRVTDSPLKETHAFATIPNAILSTSTTDIEKADHPTSPTDSAFALSPTTPTTLAVLPTTTTVTTTSSTTKSSPAQPGPGFSLLISRAGDWTTRLINNPPTHLYTRGAPVLGVLRIATLFSPCVVVTTGSGIGPCLSLFNGYTHSPIPGRPKLDIRILWSTPSPQKTFGEGVLREVYSADPRARVIDTRALGKEVVVDKEGNRMERSRRPDMVRETWRLVRESGAEGVVVIGNPAVTKKVVYGMESRGVPAFGPIWDS